MQHLLTQQKEVQAWADCLLRIMISRNNTVFLDWGKDWNSQGAHRMTIGLLSGGCRKRHGSAVVTDDPRIPQGYCIAWACMSWSVDSMDFSVYVQMLELIAHCPGAKCPGKACYLFMIFNLEWHETGLSMWLAPNYIYARSHGLKRKPRSGLLV